MVSNAAVPDVLLGVLWAVTYLLRNRSVALLQNSFIVYVVVPDTM